MTEAQRLYRALALVSSMLDHTTSDAVSKAWAIRWPDQHRYAVSLIGRSRRLLRELSHLAPDGEGS